MKRSSVRVVLPILMPVLLAAALQADTLILRDGRRIDGQLLSVRSGVIEFDVAQQFGARTLRFDREDVLGIEFSRTERNAPPFSTTTRQTGRPSGLRERQIMVAATTPWTDTNIDVRPGQDVYFQASGEIRWGRNRQDGPAGEQNSPMNPARPIPNRPAGSLIGRIGEGSDYFFIGADREPFRMRGSGRLFLGVNDDYLQDNSGAFRVVVYY